jgi:hypothetical protein
MLIDINRSVYILDEAKLEASSVSLRSDGIIHVLLDTERVFGIDDLREVDKEILKMGKGRAFPTLITSRRDDTVTTPEVRQSAASKERTHSVASAFVTQSVIQKLIVNFYIFFHKPARPTRMFNSKEKAIEWLRQFKKMHAENNIDQDSFSMR